MTYTLIALFLASGQSWVEDRHLTLQHCAGRAAMARREYLAVLPQLNEKIGPVQWRCVPESLRRVERDERGIGLSN